MSIEPFTCSGVIIIYGGDQVVESTSQLVNFIVNVSGQDFGAVQSHAEENTYRTYDEMSHSWHTSKVREGEF